MQISSPNDFIANIKKKVSAQGKIAFLSTFVIGLLVHMPILVRDIPNHDGLDSMWFDQNMITSGRWFLTVACGISSFSSIPWLIGVLALTYLSIAAIFLIKILKVENKLVIILICGLFVTFPSIASNFAYVFTMDGYMLGVLLAVISVWCVRSCKRGFLLGAVALAFSMGIYQSYLPIAMILCLYCVVDIMMGQAKGSEKIKTSLHYVYMGAIGVALYYILLKVLLAIQGKELADYQGISGMTANAGNILSSIRSAYSDFITFTIKSHVVAPNGYAVAAIIILCVCFLVAFIRLALQRKWFYHPVFYLLTIGIVVIMPIITNVICLISPGVTYHLLMRYQWVLFGIIALALIERFSNTAESSNLSNIIVWISLISTLVITFSYVVTDNIAYSNLEKKYEKTYAYCLRLADRIEQTEGYYEGIPIAMVGVVGEDNYPVTDITQEVTGNMIGMNGDYLLYTGANYQLFFRYFLGITINVLPEESVMDFYYSDAYATLHSFPASDATKVIDGILYIKTENNH